MEEWIREREYVMWLGTLGAVAASAEPRAESSRGNGERASGKVSSKLDSMRDERARADEAWLPR